MQVNEHILSSSELTQCKVHFDTTEEHNHKFATSEAARKLMHRFTEQDVDAAIKDVSKES